MPVFGRWEAVGNPAGWGWAHGLTIQRKGRRFRAQGFDITGLAPTGKTYYVKKGGNDADSGADWDHALAKVLTAIQKPDVDRIYIGAGVYDRTDGTQGIALTRSCSIIGVGDVKLTGRQSGLVWVKEGGLNFTYSTTRSSVGKVLDVAQVDANGDYLEYIQQADANAVDANAGSWYLDGANKLWVRCVDDRAPDGNIWVMLTSRNGNFDGDIHVYCENLDFIGGYAGIEFDNTGAGQTGEFYAKNCKFRHAGGNGLEITGQSLVVLQGCLAAKNSSDGLNYKALNGVIPKVIEIDCVSRDNGATGDDDNGTSMHDGGSIIRLNGQYYRNKGPNVADSAALESWNLGSLAHSSQASVAGARIDFNALGGSGVMWLDRCSAHTSENSIAAGAGSTVHRRKANVTGVVGGAGVNDEY